MRKLYILAIVLFCNYFQMAMAQDCIGGTFHLDLETPRATVRHNTDGSLWWNGSQGKFLIDDSALSDHPVSVMFAGGFWLGGRDSGGNLKVAASTYGASSGQYDWRPGPLNSEGLAAANSCSSFDKIWEVKKAEIDLFRIDFQDNGVIDNPVPSTILSWPGRNNPHSFSTNGFFLPTGRALAPFVDQNNDGKYDPMDGDYPFTKGAEVAHWWIINDNGGIHTETNGDPIKAEVSFLAYSYDDFGWAPTTIYYDVKITNKSTERLNELNAGIWVDGSLGCFIDEYIGSLPEKNMAFIYNAAEEDGDPNTACGAEEFTKGKPLLGIKILKGLKTQLGTDLGMSSFTYYQNQLTGGATPLNCNPFTSSIYYNFLSGKLCDGTFMTYGGTGYNPGSTDFTNFAFPDPPNEVGGWSMCETNPESGDRRVVISSGGVNLDSGQSTSLAFAVIVTGKVDGPCPDLSQLENAADVAQNTYDDSPTSVKTVMPTIEVSISPNPAAEFINIKLDSAEKIAALQLINAQGQVVFQKSNINDSQYQLMRNDLAAGVYILEVKNNKGYVGVEKVIFSK